MLYFLLLWQISQGFITHDEGYCKDFYLKYASNFPCANGFSKSSNIQFSGTFANPPQIILVIEALDQAKANSFSVYVKCAAGRIFSIGVRWIAIDDSRIEVINMFDTTNFAQQIIPHQNPNVEVGFVTLFTTSYSDKINFNINIVSITPTDVTIEITDPENLLGNIKQISYQIVLGVPEAINILSSLSLTANYNSPQIPDIPNTYFLVATSGYNYLKTDNIRLEVQFQLADPFIQYTVTKWSGIYVGNTHTSVQLSYSLTQYKFLKCDSVRISQQQIQDQFYVSYQPLTIKIQEISKSFTQTGTFQEFIDKSFSLINFVISLSCELNKKIKSQIYMFQQNLGVYQMQTQYHYCGGLNKIISYYIRFKQQTVSLQNLIIQRTDTSCSLSQIIFNQVKSTQIFFNFEIINV